MAKQPTKKLTAATVRGNLDPGKYHDGKGVGLFLRVYEDQARSWVQRITIDGKRREIGLGSPPVVSLALARDQAMKNKLTIRSGGDPLAEKHRVKRAANQMTFSQATEAYFAVKLKEFKSEKHAKQWRATLDTYAKPIIGDVAVDRLDVADIHRVLEPIWATKTETASRLRGRIEAVLSWATVSEYRKGDNPARWKGNLAELLPKPGKVAKKGNFPALSLSDARRWWTDLAKRDGMAAQALRFACLTASRSGEVRGMVWSEVDFDKRLWIIPAERTKTGKVHREPLTDEAIAVLRNVPRLGTMADNDEGQLAPVFFGPRGGALSDMTISAVMRRMQAAAEQDGRPGYLDKQSGRPAVPHGLRSTFRDWATERGIEHNLAELALGHWMGSKVDRAYRRTDQMEQRRKVMADWAAFLHENSTA